MPVNVVVAAIRRRIWELMAGLVSPAHSRRAY